MTDFPAAHSMDTTWFAIDADGYVGIFDSGEGGALPEDFTTVADDRIDFTGDLLSVFAAETGQPICMTNDIRHILTGNSTNILLSEIQSIEEITRSLQKDNEPAYLSGLILVLSTAVKISELQQQFGRMIELYRSDRETIVYMERCELGWLKNAIDSGFVLSGSQEVSTESGLNSLSWYWYDCNEQDPHPYDREWVPQTPIHFQDLPPIIRHHLSLTRFPNLRFAETEAIQPIEHMSCTTWGTEDWQGTDGEWYDRFPDYPHLPSRQ